MTSKSLFFKLMKEDLKQRLWAVGLAFLTFFFAMPVAAAMEASEIAQRYERWVASGTTFANSTLEMERFRLLLQLAEDIVGLQNILAAFIVGSAAVVLGLTGFMFLHSKKQVDFYNSVPVRRELLFFVKYLDGALIVFAAYFVNLLLAFGILAANGVPAGAFVSGALLAMLVHLVGFLLIYGTIVLAVVLTGNFFISVLGSMVLCAYLPAVAALLQGMVQLFFATAGGRQGKLFEEIIIHGSPIGYYGVLVSRGCEREMFDFSRYGVSNLSHTAAAEVGYGSLMKGVGLAFLAALALLLLCGLLYRLRPSEAAGKAMAFSCTKAPIKILLVVPVTFGMGVLFWNIYYSLFWAAFGFVFGLVISHCVIEIIYHFDFRKLFAHPAHMAACAVLALAVIGIYRFDLVGYDSYIPTEEQFQSASILPWSLGDWGEYGYPYLDSDGSMHWRYMNQSDYVAGNMEVTDYGLVRAIAEKGIEEAKISREARFANQWDWELPEGYWTTMEVGYRLKNGREIFRTYSVNMTEIQDVVDQLYASEEYKKGTYPVLSYTADNLVGLYEAKAGRISKLDISHEMLARILEAYQEELAALTLKERREVLPVTSLRFLTTAESDYIQMVSRNRHPGYTGGIETEDMALVNMVPVYSSFTKTLALLEEAGAVTLGTLSADEVDRIEIYNYRYEGDSTVTYSSDGPYVESMSIDEGAQKLVYENDGTPENEGRIDEILSASAPSDLAGLNSLLDAVNGIEARVFRKDTGNGGSLASESYETYVFQTGQIPDFLVEVLYGYPGEPESGWIN